MTNKIDFTKMRLGSKVNGRRIVKCAKCGKKGRLTQYSKGGQDIAHYATQGIFGGLVLRSGDYCYFNATEVLNGK